MTVEAYWLCLCCKWEFREEHTSTQRPFLSSIELVNADADTDVDVVGVGTKTHAASKEPSQVISPLYHDSVPIIKTPCVNQHRARESISDKNTSSDNKLLKIESRANASFFTLFSSCN